MLSRLSPLLALAVLVAPTTALHAQTVLGGQVVHKTKGAIIPPVAVELLGARDTVLATTTTGADGTFILTVPGGGSYRVRLTAPDAEAFVSDSLKLADGEYIAHQFPIDPTPRVYLEPEVHRRATPMAGTKAPRYPESLRQTGVTGCVIAEFVVDEKGIPDSASFRVAKFTHVDFVKAILAVLPTWRFTPAQVDGRNVRQVVRQPFTFSISSVERVEYRTEVRRVDGAPSASAGRRPLPTTSPRPSAPEPVRC
jgi:TonB family protein